MAQRYGTRPSKIIGIVNTWEAFQVDFVVMEAGVARDAEITAERRSGRPGGPPGRINSADIPKDEGSFAPWSLLANKRGVAGGIKKVKIKEDGTW